VQNCMTLPSGVFCPIYVKLPNLCGLGYFFWVLATLHSQALKTDFHAKYVKRRGSAQGRAFWGLEDKNLTFRPSFPPKTAIFGPHFDGTFRPKIALQWGCSRVNYP